MQSTPMRRAPAAAPRRNRDNGTRTTLFLVHECHIVVMAGSQRDSYVVVQIREGAECPSDLKGGIRDWSED
ncbi:hypothetical protein EVAR_61742_1 [Eumeta japonica]|uniref:Uncharacterized protein n=1 Tax=Eumeta variegata TaxID=151549 RepID=A0A4C1YLG8_EUMVA|nr:hypothetical protein EVAR_61742_1 [Eumeta japonica]